MIQPSRSSNLYRPSWVFAMAIGSAIGWGSFVLPFDWVQQSGWLGTTVGFIVGGSMIAVIGLNYGIAVRFLPVSGGGVAHALAAKGRLHCAIAGWSLALGYSSIVALNASAVPLIFRSLNPTSNAGVILYTIAGWDVYLSDVLLSSLSLVAFALIATRGAKVSGRFQFIAVALMIVTVAVLLVWTIASHGSTEDLGSQAVPDDLSLFTAAGAIVAIAPWAYVGFDSIPQLAGEFSFPPEKARRLLIHGIIGATAIYISMVIVTALLTTEGTDDLQYSVWPIADAVSNRLGPFGMLLLVFAVSAGILTGLNGFYTASSRTLMTMGRARVLPEEFARLSRGASAPSNAIYAVMVLCLITPWFGRAALSWVVDMASVGITVAYFYTSFCVKKIGKTGSVAGMRTPCQPSLATELLGNAGCILSFIFLVLLLFPGAPSSLSPQALVALAIWVAIAASLFMARRKQIYGVPTPDLHDSVFGTKPI